MHQLMGGGDMQRSFPSFHLRQQQSDGLTPHALLFLLYVCYGRAIQQGMRRFKSSNRTMVRDCPATGRQLPQY